MTADNVRELLRKAIANSPTAKAWAEANGVSPQYASDVINGAREPGDAILKALGLERVIVYRKVRK
jgi:hypothetical protein